MTESKVGGLPPLPDIGPEGWYTRADMIAYARAALSAHGALLFTQADMERFAGYVADAREERLKSAHGENASVPQPVVDEAMVKRAVDATEPPDRTCLDHEEYAEAILTAALTGADHAHP